MRVGASSDSCSLERRPGATSAGAGTTRAVRLATELETTGNVPFARGALRSAAGVVPEVGTSGTGSNSGASVVAGSAATAARVGGVAGRRRARARGSATRRLWQGARRRAAV